METKIEFRITLAESDYIINPKYYSKYEERENLKSEGKLNEEIYGLEQVIDHVREIKEAWKKNGCDPIQLAIEKIETVKNLVSMDDFENFTITSIKI